MGGAVNGGAAGKGGDASRRVDTNHAGKTGAPAKAMTRIFLIVVAAGLLLLAVGMVLLGAFPPNPQPQAVEKTLPNDRFQGR